MISMHLKVDLEGRNSLIKETYRTMSDEVRMGRQHNFTVLEKEKTIAS